MHILRILHFGVLTTMIASCAPAPENTGPVVVPQVAGRVAGPPESCVPIESSASMTLENRSAFVYNTGTVVWVSSTNCPATADDLPVFHPTGSQYCRGDIVQMVDRSTHMPGPACILGDFVPYRRP